MTSDNDDIFYCQSGVCALLQYLCYVSEWSLIAVVEEIDLWIEVSRELSPGQLTKGAESRVKIQSKYMEF